MATATSLHVARTRGFCRYRVDRKRRTATVHGSKTDAQRELRRLIREADEGVHVAPDRMTLRAWVERWLELLARGDFSRSTARACQRAHPRALRRASGVLYSRRSAKSRCSGSPSTTSMRSIWRWRSAGSAYGTVRHTHTALKACLTVAVRKGLLVRNPAADASVPPPVDWMSASLSMRRR